MDTNLLLDAVQDSLKTFPLLLGTFLLLEWLEYRYGPVVRERIRHAGKAGPVLGAIFGSLPHFSLVGSALYSRRLVTLGALLAVYLASSDEAIPVIVAQPKHISVTAPLVLILVLTKVGVGIIFGILIDLVSRMTQPATPVVVTEHAMAGAAPADFAVTAVDEHADEEEIHADGCCGHHEPAERRGWALFKHPLLHAGKVFLFILLINIALNVLMERGQGTLERLLLHNSPWQPLAAALVGLIPNCAASVAITQLYLKGAISFGSVIAGTCCCAGVGLLVLLRENSDRRDTLRVIVLLLSISFGVGLLIQTACPSLLMQAVSAR